MTDKPLPKKPVRANAKPKPGTKRQVDLPLLDAATIAAPAPVPVTPAPQPALADRAARYNRHRSALDDRPLAEQITHAPIAPRTPVQARPYLQARAPEPPRDEPVRAEMRPKALDMASIAARNRQARDAAREERPLAHPTPPSQRQRVERLAAEPSTPTPKPRDESMLARAARHNTLLRDEQERATQLAQQPVEVKSPVAQRQRLQPDNQSMVERAAEATKRRRQALGGPLPAEPVQEVQAAPMHLTTTAFVLVSRNDGGRVRDRLTAWRALVEAPDVRWWLLDLGSVDESVAHAEELHVNVLSVPGGAVEPMATLAMLLRRVEADTVIIADADAMPDKRSLRVLADVRAGQRVAAAPAERPGVLAIDASMWRRDGTGQAPDLSVWAKRSLPGDTPLLPTSHAFIPRLLHAPRVTQLAAKARPWLLRIRGWVGR